MDQTVDILTVEKVDAVLARVASLGLDWRASRFATYRQELVAQRAADRAFLAVFRGDEGRQRLSFEAGAQLLQLLLAATVWDRLDRHLLKRALETVFDGPPLDPPDDDRPRNTLLELVAAANLADRFQVSLTTNAKDVRLDHPLQSEDTPGTRCTAWNNHAASAALCRATVRLSLPALAVPAVLGVSLGLGQFR
jgi:hypothetical protein